MYLKLKAVKCCSEYFRTNLCNHQIDFTNCGQGPCFSVWEDTVGGEISQGAKKYDSLMVLLGEQKNITPSCSAWGATCSLNFSVLHLDVAPYKGLSSGS